MRTSLRNRIVTAAVAAPIALLIIFFAPDEAAFLFFAVAFFMAAIEFIPMARHLVPSAPLKGLWLFIPLATLLPFWALQQDLQGDLGNWWIVGLAMLMVVSSGSVLFSTTDIKEGLAAIGVMSFAIPYFSVPPLALYRLKQADPLWILLLVGIVWLGDTAAYFFGRHFGRHKLAPATSPNKTWEGAAASLVVALGTTAVWCALVLESSPPLILLAITAFTSMAAQSGDLIESLIKRGAGVKDSSNILPGHGGFFDRLDALFLSTPIFFGGVWLFELQQLMP